MTQCNSQFLNEQLRSQYSSSVFGLFSANVKGFFQQDFVCMLIEVHMVKLVLQRHFNSFVANFLRYCTVMPNSFHWVFYSLSLRGCDDRPELQEACDWLVVPHHHRDIEGRGKSEQRRVLLFCSLCVCVCVTHLLSVNCVASQHH